MNSSSIILGSFTSWSTLLLTTASHNPMDWAKFGLLGLVLAGLFYFIIRPTIKHLTESQVSTQKEMVKILSEIKESNKNISHTLIRFSEEITEIKLKIALEHSDLKKNLDRLQQDLNNIKNK